MSTATSIEWTDATWNPVRGCARVSPGCEHCYAEVMAARFSDPGMWGHGFAERTEHGARWTRKVAPVPERLDEPLHWRKPRRVFVNSTSDLFHEDVPDEFIAAVFGVMAAARRHTFQVLTKRPERMARWFEWVASKAPAEREQWIEWVAGAERACGEPVGSRGAATMPGECMALWHAMNDALPRHRVTGVYPHWPLPNVWLGVSVEDQRRADERIPHLLRVPAAVRFLSCEPLLGPVGLYKWMLPKTAGLGCWHGGQLHPWEPGGFCPPSLDGQPGRLDWVIVGGESGPGARPFDLAWARSLVAQCRAAQVPAFVKQLGAEPVEACGCEVGEVQGGVRRCADCLDGTQPVILRDRKGGKPEEWPEDLRVRQWPEAPHA